MQPHKAPVPAVPYTLDKLYLAQNYLLVEIPAPKKESEGGILLPDTSSKADHMCRVVALADFDDEVIEDCGLGIPTLGMTITLGAGMLATPDFSIDGVEYRILGWDELTHVWRP